jgi:hypothetical protein
MEPYYFSPSERQATTVAEFLAACQAEWLVAVHHLREGYFEPWLRDVGRRDLAEAAARIRSSGSVTRQRLQEFVQVARDTERRTEARGASTLMGTKASDSKKGA